MKKNKDIVDKFLDTTIVIGLVGLAIGLGIKMTKKRGVC